LKILVLGGAGTQGSIICHELVKHKKVSEVICADKDVQRAEALKKRLKSEKVLVQHVDINNVDDLRRTVKGCDLVINAALYTYDLRVMKTALDERASFQGLAIGECIEAPHLDIDGVLELMLKMNEDFKKAGRTALIAAGEAPGVTDLIVGYAADKFDRIHEVWIKECNIIEAEGVVYTWAPTVLWQDMIEDPYIIQDGVLRRVPPFSGEEMYTFPEPLGRQPCYHHYHEEIPIMARFIKDLQYAEWKMCGPFMTYAKAAYDLGLLKTEKIKVDTVEVSPFDVFCTLLPRPPSIDEVVKMIEEGKFKEEILCVIVDIKCEHRNRWLDVSYVSTVTLKDVYKRLPGATATSYFVGVAAESFAEAFAEGLIKTTGVIPPETLSKNEKVNIIKKLAEKGIKIYETIKGEVS
jgi:saccharopine dehydrogenase-like NADP-dependent oxidoreductase